MSEFMMIAAKMSMDELLIRWCKQTIPEIG